MPFRNSVGFDYSQILTENVDYFLWRGIQGVPQQLSESLTSVSYTEVLGNPVYQCAPDSSGTITFIAPPTNTRADNTIITALNFTATVSFTGGTDGRVTFLLGTSTAWDANSSSSLVAGPGIATPYTFVQDTNYIINLSCTNVVPIPASNNFTFDAALYVNGILVGALAAQALTAGVLSVQMVDAGGTTSNVSNVTYLLG